MFESSFVTYSQNGEDVLLWRALKDVPYGFYIDIGAQDPVHDSVTKAFYDRGWRGINLEPVQRWHDRLVQDRPHDINLRLAASNQSGAVKLFEVEESGLSTSDPQFAHRHEVQGYKLREYMVECATLDQICADNDVSTVHFLKIDCEGSEKPALEGASLSAVRPWIILVEATEPNSIQPTWHQWEHLLTGRGYRFVFFDGLNRYYLADEHAELAFAFAAPVNVFDSVRRLSDIDAQEQIERLQGQIEGLMGAATVAKLQTQLKATQSDLRSMTARFDVAVVERAVALTERNTAVAERDVAATERDAAAAERNTAIIERTAAVTAREHLSASHSALQRQTVAQDAELVRLRERVTELLSSSSWRVTAPLRGCSRASRQIYRWIRGVLYVVLRPFARTARPSLRWVAQSRSIRWCVTTVFGRRSRIVEHARLFLFGGAPHVSSKADLDHPGTDVSSAQERYEWPDIPSERLPHLVKSAEPFDLDEVMERVRAEVARRRMR